MNRGHYIAILLTLTVCFATLLMFFLIEKREIRNKEPEEAPYQIQVVLKSKANPPDFWRIVEQGVTVAAEEYGAVCEVTGPVWEGDVQHQIELMEHAIKKSPDAIILAAADYERLAPVCESAVKAGILLMTMDSDVNFAGRKCFVGTDNYQLGKSLAEQVDLLTETRGKVGVISHVAAATTAIEREQGLRDNLADAQNRIAEVAYCGSVVETAHAQTIDMLARYPDIACMVGLNESSALGVALAVEELGLQGQVMVVACDSSQTQIQMMERGVIQAFVIQNPFNMGYVSVKYAIDLLSGVSVPESYDTKSTVVEQDTLFKTENQKILFPFVEEY